MSGAQIHIVAEEAELWLALTVHSWVVLTALIWAGRKLAGRPEAAKGLEAVFAAVEAATYTIVVSTILFAMTYAAVMMYALSTQGPVP